MSSEKHQESLNKIAERQTVKDKAITDITMFIINYFEENFEAINYTIDYNVFMNKLIDSYPDMIKWEYSSYYMNYNKTGWINAYKIWKKIKNEYDDKYERKYELLKQH